MVSEKEWQNEIKGMLSTGLKFELDALANKDFQYLTKTYLPKSSKIKIGWISVKRALSLVESESSIFFSR